MPIGVHSVALPSLSSLSSPPPSPSAVRPGFRPMLEECDLARPSPKPHLRRTREVSVNIGKIKEVFRMNIDLLAVPEVLDSRWHSAALHKTHTPTIEVQ